MFCVAMAIDYASGLPLIVAAGVAMYIASKALADALVNGDTARTGRLALGHWLPIAVLGIVAAGFSRLEIAVGVIFSTAIACLALAVGAVAMLGEVSAPAAARRTWAMLVPAGLLVFLAGFRASVPPFAAGAMALQGMCVLLVWNDRASTSTKEKSEILLDASHGIGFRSAEFLLALILAGIGAWLALHGIDQVAANSEFASAGLLTATLLSPMLVLPIIGTGTEMAQRKQSSAAVSSHVGVALLNACALLPLVVLTSYLRQYHDKVLAFAQVPFPLAVWRVDVIVFIALGMFLLPVALGRWSLSRLQGMGLLFGYVLYLALSILIGVRRV